MKIKPAARHDGWTIPRRTVFIAAIAAGRGVADAAATVGMSRESAYRLAARPGGEAFALAWYAAATQGRAIADAARAARHRRPPAPYGTLIHRRPRDAAERRDQERALMAALDRLERLSNVFHA